MTNVSRRFMSAAVSLLLIATSVWTAFAQGSNTLAATIDSSTFPELTLTTTVLSPKGVPVAGLTEAAFTAQEDDQPLKIESVTAFQDDQAPVLLVLAMDLSANIQGKSLIDAKAAAQAVIGQLGPNDKLAVLAFSKNISLQQPLIFDPAREINFTADKAQLRSFVDGLKNVTTATPLYDPTFKAIRMLVGQPQAGTRRAVILMTDGTDTGSSTKVDDLLSEATTNRIPIFTVALGTRADVKNLERIALTTTGSSHLTAKDATELQGRFQEIFQNMKLSYRIVARSQLNGDDAKHKWVLNLDVPGGGAQASGQFLAPRSAKPQIIKVEYTDQGQTYELKDGLELKGTITIRPTVNTVTKIVSALYIIDEQAATQTQILSEPWTFDWNTCELTDGAHTLRIHVTDDKGQADERTFSLNTLKGGPLTCGVGPLSPTMLLVMGGVVLLLIVIGLVVLIARRRQPIQDPAMATMLPMPETLPPMPMTTPPPPAPVSGAPTSAYSPTAAPYVPPAPAVSGGRTRAITDGPSDSGASGSRLVKTEVIGPTRSGALAWLIIKQGPHAGKEFRLSEATTIGRDSEHCDITLADGGVSGQHAKVKLEGDQYFLWDLASTNGTFIRKADGSEERIQKHPLADGTEARMGSTILVFKQIQ